MKSVSSFSSIDDWAIFLSCQFEEFLLFGTCLGVQYFVYFLLLQFAFLALTMHLFCFQFYFPGRRKQRRRRKPRSVWVRKWLSDKRRQRYCQYSTLLNKLKSKDEKTFFNYTRLPRGLYNEVLQRIEGMLEKKNTRYRKSLPPGLKLPISLRHLACWDSYPNLSYNFRVPPNTITLIA